MRLGLRRWWGWDCGGDKAHHIRGEWARQSPGCLSCLGRGRHKTQAQPSLCFCGVSKNWNHRQPRASSLWRSLEPEQCRRGKHSPLVGANPVWLEHCRSSPHTPVIFVCSAPPSPQHDWTSEPKQETTFPACVRVEIRHWRDQQTEAKYTKATASEVTGATD